MPSSSGISSRTGFRLAFGLFVGSIFFSVAGTLLYEFVPPAQTFFAPYWSTLVKSGTWIYMILLPVLTFLLYIEELGWGKSVAAFVLGSGIGAAAELLGTVTGFPFGAYAYNDWLGPKIAGHVPYLIPPSWYAIALVSLDLARRMGLSRRGRIGMVAVFMVLWDVALDPAMNAAFPFWTYNDGGVFFGMPLQNWFGWVLTSLVIGAAFEYGLGGLREAPSDFVRRWAPIYYAVNMLFSVILCLLYGVPVAALWGLAALGLALGALRLRELQRETAAVAS